MATSNKLLGACIALCAASSTSVSAAVVEYHCVYKVHGQGGFLSEKAIFLVDEAKGTAKALDNLVSDFHKKPIPAELSHPTTKRIQLDWKIADVPITTSTNQNFEVNIAYKATINVTNNTSKVRARIDRELTNNLSASGRCKVKK